MSLSARPPTSAGILPYFPLVTFLGDVIERLARPPQEIRAEHLRHWASSIQGTTPIGSVQARSRYKIAGVIQNIRIDPGQGSGSIEATVDDGSGRIIVKWLGRQTLSGITLGAGLVFEGIVGEGPRGNLQVLNPEYELMPNPEHG